ncbi:MAG: hypothetical protein MZU97_13760 [Bacillus subtilis]|nr:hypothetical protein [Bacillus subtilis]
MPRLAAASACPRSTARIPPRIDFGDVGARIDEEREHARDEARQVDAEDDRHRHPEKRVDDESPGPTSGVPRITST